MASHLDLTGVMPFFPDVDESNVRDMASELTSLIEAGKIDRLQGFRFEKPYSEEALVVGIKALAQAQFGAQNAGNPQSLVRGMTEVAAQKRYFFACTIEANNTTKMLVEMQPWVSFTPYPKLTKILPHFPSMHLTEVEHFMGLFFGIVKTGGLDGVRGIDSQKPCPVGAIVWGVKALVAFKDERGLGALASTETAIDFIKSWVAQPTAEDFAAANTLMQMRGPPADPSCFKAPGNRTILNVKPFVPIGPVDDEDLPDSPSIAPAHRAVLAPPTGPVQNGHLTVPPSIDPARGGPPAPPSVDPARGGAPATPQNPKTVCKNTGSPLKRRSETPAKEPKNKLVRPPRAQGGARPSRATGSSAPGPRPPVPTALSLENLAMMSDLGGTTSMYPDVDVVAPRGQNKKKQRRS